jgi:hypothetical protein
MDSSVRWSSREAARKDISLRMHEKASSSCAVVAGDALVEICSVQHVNMGRRGFGQMQGTNQCQRAKINTEILCSCATHIIVEVAAPAQPV